MRAETTPIADYAVIGDSESAALVSRSGSIDWLCLPRFDSAACFAALLGDAGNGRWLLGPVGTATTTRRYLGDSTVLETVHESAEGAVRVQDFMPVGDGRSDVVRRVEGLRGRVELEQEWVVRTGYGAIVPWVSRSRDAEGGEELTAVAGPDRLTLRGDPLPTADGRAHRGRFEVAAGQVRSWVLTWSPSWQPPPGPLDVEASLAHTLGFFTAWAGQVDLSGPYRAAVVRSLVVLRQLTDHWRGGIVAAVTTSLPERDGGARNWDYRYSWLRDAAMTVRALLRSGHRHQARAWRDWLVRAVAGDPQDLQIMYAVDGGRDLAERELPHLAGYASSRPVRIGNAAVHQRQGDVIGAVMLALADARDHGLTESADVWNVQRVLLDHLELTWDQPDSGLWEVRGPAHHFTHSGVMAWAAFDQAVRAVEVHGFDGPVQHWRGLRDHLHATVLERGFDTSRGSFVQHEGTSEVDAALLLIPTTGFLAGDGPRVLGTIAAVEQDLRHDGMVQRYRTEAVDDGVGGEEAAFVACGFWLASAYARAGRPAEARAQLDRMLAATNDLGLLAEEYDPSRNRMAGNFPQALSHLALVGAVYDLRDAQTSRP